MSSVCTFVHLTTVHDRNDTRVFLKQITDLTKKFAGGVFVVNDGKGNQTYDNFHIVDLNIFAKSKLLRILFAPLKGLLTVLRLNPRIVHFHDSELIPVGIILSILGYKVIYDVHEDLPRDMLSKEWIPIIFRKPLSIVIGKFELFASAFFTQIICVTEHIANNFPSHKTIVVQNFPKLNEFGKIDTSDYIERPPNFIYVGMMFPERGVNHMLKLIQRTNEIGSQRSNLYLGGPFAPKSFYDDVQKHPGWNYVEYEEWASRDLYASWLKNTKIGLLLLTAENKNNIESQPNKLFEYMSGGIPIVATNFPSWKAFIEDTKCGILVDPSDEKAVLDATQYLLNNPKDAYVMGLNGRKAVFEKFNWEIEVKKLFACYEHLLNS